MQSRPSFWPCRLAFACALCPIKESATGTVQIIDFLVPPGRFPLAPVGGGFYRGCGCRPFRNSRLLRGLSLKAFQLVFLLFLSIKGIEKEHCRDTNQSLRFTEKFELTRVTSSICFLFKVGKIGSSPRLAKLGYY